MNIDADVDKGDTEMEQLNTSLWNQINFYESWKLSTVVKTQHAAWDAFKTWQRMLQ